MISPALASLTLALFGAAAAGLVGAFALMRRMTLAGDVISHVALPGIGLALLFHLNPIAGGAATLLLGTVLIWHLERRASLSTDTAIGVVFAASLAVGALVTPSEDLIEALFGAQGGTSFGFLAFGIALAAAIITTLWVMRNKLILSLFSPDLARSVGVNVDRANLIYLLLFSASILLGLRALGALLVGGLIIIPAAISRQLTHTLAKFLATSVAVSIISVVGGYAISERFALEFGPSVVVVASGLFVLSLLKKKD